MECRHPNHPKNNTTRMKVKTQARAVYESDNTHEETPVEH